MLSEPAIVKRRVDDRVEVELVRESACAGCDLNQGCGTGALGRLLGKRKRPLLVSSERELHPGDRVVLSLPEAALVRVSLLVYGLPLLGMLVGAGVAHLWLALPEWQVVAFGAAGFFLGFRGASRLVGGLAQRQLLPTVIDIEMNPGPGPGSNILFENRK